MASKHHPPQRLVDVLKKNSPQTLRKHAEQLAVLQTALPPEVLETRYRHNSVLVSPKSLHLMLQPELLRRWGVFAIYKPAFCPMKRKDAHHNYHRVSVESFLSAALSSREVLPVVRETLDPRQVRVRVLYSLDTEVSGPVVVTLNDAFPFVHSMQHVRLLYQLLVAGHLPVEESMRQMDPTLVSTLYPSSGSSNAASTAATTASTKGESAPPVFEYRVKQTGFYAHHPVSLVELQLASPPSASPPRLPAFVDAAFQSFIIGDPSAMGRTTASRRSTPENSPRDTRAGASSSGRGLEPSSLVLRGDCDFPRVFAHLRQVTCKSGLPNPLGSEAKAAETAREDKIDENVMDFQCNQCFEPIIQAKQLYGLKGISMNIHDGSWSPMSEMLP